MGYDYCVVIPAHNEEDSLEGAVDEVRKAVAGLRCQILIAEDGSRDGTLALARRLSRKYKNVALTHSAGRLGRGGALQAAFHKADAKVVAYIDADLSPEPRFLKPLLKAARDCDAVTGSRYLPQSVLQRDSTRRVASSAYNFLVRLILGSKLYDHQCGFKAFKKKSVLELFEHAESRDWFLDTELMVLAQKLGFCTREIPIVWAERKEGDSKVSVLKDAMEMFSSTLGLRVRLWKKGIAY